MSIFKSPKRKVFRKAKDVDALIHAARDLNNIVEGPLSVRWMSEASGRRLKDAPEWCAFYVALNKLLPVLLLLVLVGCSSPPVPAQKHFAMVPPMPAGETRTNKVIGFAWSHPHPATVEFYRLYYGPAPRSYTNFVVCLDTNTTFLADMTSPHYFTVTANATNLESDYCNEVIFPMEIVPRTNVVLISQWSTNMIDWQDVRRETNVINGNLGFWRLRIE